MSALRTSRRLRLVALTLCAALGSGCAHLQTPRIDPTGQRIFAEPPIRTQPVYTGPISAAAPWDAVAVTLSPATTVAPVGSDVILVAGVVAGDNHYDMNRRLEWHLAGGSVGHFVSVGRGSFVDLLLGDFNRPRKVDATYAIGSTSRRYEQLSRGLASAGSDICTVPGQGWISVSSPVEGTSYVAVHAPEVSGWNARTRTAVIHWIDAQFAYPPPSITRAGATHPLTTTVTKQSDGTPWEGWTVRYRVTAGPPAGFVPDGTDMIEVLTDASGRATAELMQTAPGPGTNVIAIEVFRPVGAVACPTTVPGPSADRLLVASTSVTKTWSAASLAVQKTGPARATVGAAVTYRIIVSNPGDLPAENVLATDRMPEVLEYLSSNPPAQLAGGQPQWQIGRLAPREQRVLEVHFRARSQGTATNCVDVTAAGQLSATGCTTTTIGAELPAEVPSAIDIRIEGPRQAAVGQKVKFHMLVTNRAAAPSGELTIKNRFDEGLQHEVHDPKRTIEAKLGSLAPGETQQVDIDFTVLKAGEWCHTAEVVGPAGTLATARACLSATGIVPEQPAREATVSVKKAGPAQGTVGQLADFTIDVTNTGQNALTNVRVIDRYDAALLPREATEGYQLEDGNLVWTFAQLQPGQTARIQIRCNCLQPAAKACNRVSVTSNEGARGSSEACLEIRQTTDKPAPPGTRPEGTLSLTVTDLRGMVAAGKELTYVVQVVNNGITPDRQVVVTATLPEGMTPVRLGTTGPAEPSFDGQTVRFPPVPEIKPGQTLTYRVRAQTKKPGKVVFRVTATSQRQQEPLVGEETTEVFN